jgi:hypothetical protein
MTPWNAAAVARKTTWATFAGNTSLAFDADYTTVDLLAKVERADHQG